MKMQIFVVISSPFICAHILGKAAGDNKNIFKDVADTDLSNFYSDNPLTSFDTKDEAI